MTHLIKLELKKFGIAQNIIFMFAAILFSILFITISLWDSMNIFRCRVSVCYIGKHFTISF